MQKLKLVLPTLLVAIMFIGISHPISASDGPPAPNLRIKPAALYVAPCSNFIVELWITDIPDGYEMYEFVLLLEWDPMYMELVGIDDPEEWYEGRGWDIIGGSGDVDWTGFTAQALTIDDYWSEDAPWLRVSLHCLQEGTSTLTLSSGNEHSIYLWQPDSNGQQYPTYPDDFTVLVHQRPPNVGGTFITTNKLAVLAPYLGLVGLVAAVASAAVLMKRRKN